MSPLRVALLISLLAIAARPLPAQQEPNPAPATAAARFNRPVATLRATARLVILDVVVTDGNGNPVKGLKPSDFALSEDGVPQNFASFSEHQSTDSNPSASESSLPPNTFTVQPPLTEEGTKTVIVLDKLTYPDYPLVRNDIMAFMKTVAPGNPIAIIRLDWRGMHLVQGFTSDPQRLQEAVAGNRWLPPTLPLPDIRGRVPYAGVINPYQRLARYLAGIPGRINLAWVTDEGMPDDFRGNDYPELTNMVSNLNASTNVLRLSRITPYVIKAGGGIGGMLPPLSVPDLVISRLFPESHLEIPVSDPTSFATAQGSLLSNQVMGDIATAAGGHTFFNGADRALAQIMAIGANYYTLSYVPTNPNWNGAYRKIAIHVSGMPEVKSSRTLLDKLLYFPEEARVQYRPGYYARTKPDPSAVSGSTTFGMETTASPANQPIAALSPGVVPISASSANVIPHAPSALEAAMGFGTLTPDQVSFTIVVTPSPAVEKPKSAPPSAKDNFITDPFRNATYRNYKVHYWIDPNGLRFSRTANGTYRDDLQFVAIVYRDDGFVANSVSITAHIQVSANNLENLLTTGVIFDQSIAMPSADKAMAENYFFRVGVNETSTGHIGALELPADWIKLSPQPTANDTVVNPAASIAPPQ